MFQILVSCKPPTRVLYFFQRPRCHIQNKAHSHNVFGYNVVCHLGVYCCYPEQADRRVMLLLSSLVSSSTMLFRYTMCNLSCGGLWNFLQSWSCVLLCSRVLILCVLHHESCDQLGSNHLQAFGMGSVLAVVFAYTRLSSPLFCYSFIL